MMQFLIDDKKINGVHRIIMQNAYTDMCARIRMCGLNMLNIKVMDTNGEMQIEEGDGEDEGNYIIHIRFSDTFSGFLQNMIEAIGFIGGGKNWLEELPDKPSISDIWYSVFNDLPEAVQNVF